MAQRHDRVHTHRARRGNIAGNQRNHRDKHDHRHDVIESCTLTPYSKLAMPRVSAKPPTAPSNAPPQASFMPSRMVIPRISSRSAPRATRTPKQDRRHRTPNKAFGDNNNLAVVRLSISGAASAGGTVRFCTNGADALALCENRAVISDAKKRSAFQHRLLTWFRHFQRDLPWRRSKDPYRVWVSEIMLQQTRVAAVIPYYMRFLQRFTDVRALAGAPPEEVLRLWSGLGYYGRARNLQRAAQQIVMKHLGEFPRDLRSTLELPGIGAYTAAAILSIAYGRKLAVLDGNVARVLARIGVVRGVLREPKRWAALQNTADSLLARRAPGDWNQAMMELGATVCTPRAPQCLLCPVAQYCGARKKGLVEELPEKRSKRATVAVKLATAVLVDPNGRTLLLPPPSTSRLMSRRAQTPDHVPTLVSRMWHFPTVSVRANAVAELRKLLWKMAGRRDFSQTDWRHAGTVRHAVTFRAITLEVFRVSVENLPSMDKARDVPLDALADLPISNLTRKVARAAENAIREIGQRPKTNGGETALHRGREWSARLQQSSTYP